MVWEILGRFKLKMSKKGSKIAVFLNVAYGQENASKIPKISLKSPPLKISKAHHSYFLWMTTCLGVFSSPKNLRDDEFRVLKNMIFS